MAVETVAKHKARLLAAGQDLSGACGAFKITAAVAWELRADGWGLIHSGGNGCETHGDKFRADTIMLHDGSVIDLLGKAESDNGDTSHPENYNIPQWNPTGPQPPENWRAPFDPGDGPPSMPVPPIPEPVPVPVPPPGCGCKAELLELHDALQTQIDVLRGEIAIVKKMVPKGVESSGTLYGLRVNITSKLTY